jgi:hypothetical protein
LGFTYFGPTMQPVSRTAATLDTAKLVQLI